MKKLLLVLLIFQGIISSVSSQEKGIIFEKDSSFANLKEKAKLENKLIFVDFYAFWCKPCKWMSLNVFTNDTIANFYKKFVCSKFDVEKGEGKKLAKYFEVMCYPTYLFIDSTGRVVHRTSGAWSVNEFLLIGEDALDPRKQYITFMDKFESLTMKPEEIVYLMKLRDNSCLPIKKEMSEYLDSQFEKDYSNNLNWSVMRDFEIDPKFPVFKYLLSHYELFSEKHSADSVNNLIKRVYKEAMEDCASDAVKYQTLRSEVTSLCLPFSEQFALKMDLTFFEQTNNWKQYADSAISYVDKYAFNNYVFLNNTAYKFYQNVKDTTSLKKALSWVEHSIELKPTYISYDTYAGILYLLNRKSEALSAITKAIELEKENGSVVPSTQELFDKIKEMK
ncbi:MAG: thioredoxin family protein [Minisyncoccia bacterium]